MRDSVAYSIRLGFFAGGVGWGVGPRDSVCRQGPRGGGMERRTLCLRTSPFLSREQEIMDAAVAAGLSVRREAGGRELGGSVQYSHLLACITHFVRTLDSILFFTIMKRCVSEDDYFSLLAAAVLSY